MQWFNVMAKKITHGLEQANKRVLESKSWKSRLIAENEFLYDTLLISK